MAGRAFRTAIAALLVTALYACSGDDGDDEVNSPTIDAVYVAVLRHLDLPTAPDDEPTTVYVVDLEDEPLSLDDQVAIIQELDGTYDIQFFDTLDAVTDLDEDGHLVAPADVPLVVIGAPTTDGDSDRLMVRTELITDDGDATAWQLTLDGEEGELRVVASNQIQPELLVDPAA
jgi:hypothetical protein